MLKKYVNRCLKLADFLVTVPVKQFNIYDICSETECGTVACVAGWAGYVPAFRKAGLKSDPERRNILYLGKEFVGDVREPLRNVQNFLGLTLHEANNLFLRNGYSGSGRITQKMAAKKLREIVSDRMKSETR